MVTVREEQFASQVAFPELQAGGRVELVGTVGEGEPAQNPATRAVSLRMVAAVDWGLGSSALTKVQSVVLATVGQLAKLTGIPQGNVPPPAIPQACRVTAPVAQDR